MHKKMHLICVAIVFMLNNLIPSLSAQGVKRSKQIEKTFSHTFTHVVQRSKNDRYQWQQESEDFLFNELILSWNALRPGVGKYVFWARAKVKKWSAWLKVAEWGARGQRSFCCSKDALIKVNANVLTVNGKKKATAFDIKVEAFDGASIEGVHRLYVCASDEQKFSIIQPFVTLSSGVIEGVPLQSQMRLKHPQAGRLCSPTAVSIVLSFLLERACKGSNVAPGKLIVDPVDFAEMVHDDNFNIYGNWALNVAAAYDISGGKIPCRVERLVNFNCLYEYLKRDIPVVVSVQGPLKGGAKPYKHGHLMVVIGWDAKNKKVLCIDSAFDSTRATKVWYDIKSFLKAWGRRRNLVYLFYAGVVD